MTDRIIIPEIVPPTRRLGRHVLHDPRSWDFQAEQAAKIVSVDHAATGLPLDQGNVGSCTAEALVGALNCQPDRGTRAPYDQAEAYRVYGLETQLEGQPWPPNDPGGTGLEVCKAAKQMGLIQSYSHAFSLNAALLALVVRPVIVGVAWYSSFDSPGKNGLCSISRGATVRGGHELVLTAIDVKKKWVGGYNSWGPGWGAGGRFWWTYATFQRLLREQGDCTVPIP
jgi:hypothetical protein